MVGWLSVEEGVSELVIDVSPTHSHAIPESLEWNIVVAPDRRGAVK